MFPSQDWGAQHCSALGLPSPRLYFNSGVLLMDLARLREGGYVSEIVEFASARLHPALTLQALEPGADAAGLRRHASLHPGQLIFGDQDAMNAVLAGERLALHPRWNCMNQLRLPWSVDVFGERGHPVRRAIKRVGRDARSRGPPRRVIKGAPCDSGSSASAGVTSRRGPR